MNVVHGCGKKHAVWLCDDGTMDTVVEVDGREVRYSEADRDRNGCVKSSWLRSAAIEACQDGVLEAEEG
jgi:hypothetical protein